MKNFKLVLAFALLLNTYAFTEEIKIYGEYLYWQAVQDELQYAAVIPGGVQPLISAFQATDMTISETLDFVEPKFKYHSGFRVGIGYEDCECNWDATLSWTRLHQTSSSSVHSDTQGIIPLTLPASTAFGFIGRETDQFGFANGALSRWKLEFDTVDLQFGLVCNFACVKARPFVGLKVASIKQKQNIEYLGFVVDNSAVIVQNMKKNNFTGVGPSIGLDAACELLSNLNLFGRVGGAILCGKFNVENHPFVSLAPNFIELKAKNPRKDRLRPEIDARIGLSWNATLCNQFNILLGCSYEVQYWWNQWQAPSSIESSLVTGNASSKGDLMMQGLTVTLQMGF